MIDVDSHILRITNKVKSTFGKVYVYKIGPQKFQSSVREITEKRHELVGVYLSRGRPFNDDWVGDDIRWAVKGMK